MQTNARLRLINLTEWHSLIWCLLLSLCLFVSCKFSISFVRFGSVIAGAIQSKLFAKRDKGVERKGSSERRRHQRGSFSFVGGMQVVVSGQPFFFCKRLVHCCTWCHSCAACFSYTSAYWWFPLVPFCVIPHFFPKICDQGILVHCNIHLI